jgi:hypothetical protein
LHQKVVAWDGAKYVWTGNYKGEYAHYWRAMWGQKENDKQKSLLAVGDCITRAANSTWWNWEDGSRPFFWRWSEEYCRHIRDRIPLWYRGDPPRHFASQRKEKDPEVRKNMGTKLMTVLARRYFEYGLILSLTSFFSVSKGYTYIWMVYNFTSSGMNTHLWAPWVRSSHNLRSKSGFRGGNFHGGFRYWRNVFELHAGGKMRVFGGSAPYALCTQR